MNNIVRADVDPYRGVPSVADQKGAFGHGVRVAPDAAEPPDEDVLPLRRLRVVAAASLKMRPALWLWTNRVPSGAITLLTGREGIGKSTTSYDLISQITRGVLPGSHYGTPKGVGIVATEDAWEEVILPRLHAAGADVERVFQFEAVNPLGDTIPLSVPADLPNLKDECAEHDIVLIVLDPLMSVIPSGIDTHKDRDVRTALDPLAKFCASSGVAVLGLIHVNKSTGTDPLNSVMASRAFTAVARSVLYCIVDPEAEQQDRYVFGHVKSNLGPKQPGLKYRINQVVFEVEGDDGELVEITTSRVVWMGEDERTIASLMEPRKAERAKGETAMRILDWIGEQAAPVSAGDVIKELHDLKPNTVRVNLRRLVAEGRLHSGGHNLYKLAGSDGTK